MEGQYHRVLFISDIHCPFQDDKAIEAMVLFAQWWKPQTIVFIGDVVDFYAISSFVKDPNRSLKLADELSSAKDTIDFICKMLPDTKKYFIKGNHEARLQKYLWSTAKELANLNELRLEYLLGLKNHDIEYIENGNMKFRGTMIKHGNVVRKYAGYTARAEFEKNGISGVSGHTHRLATYYHNNEGGSYVWMEIGCLCRFDAEYLQGETPNWQTGFGIGYFKENSKRFHLEAVPIVNCKAMYGGNEFYI